MGSAVDLAPGAIFAREFRIIRPLAEGGMGAVYVAEQISTSKQRALKVMHAQIGSSPRHRERFAMEARISSQIESDHVVEVVGAGVDEASGTPWIAMELLRGKTLSAVVDEKGPMPHDEAREVARQIGHALGQAHENGLVHRDLKPDNLFMAVPRRSDVPFTVKILDFGIAKWVQEARDATKNSQIIGTPFWMAPEQLEQGANISPATDVWALGLIFFYLFTGRMYWKAANVQSPSVNALLLEMITGTIDPGSERAGLLGCEALLPARFDGWFAQCVDRDPTHRFPNATAALSALREATAPTSAGVARMEHDRAPAQRPAAQVFTTPPAMNPSVPASDSAPQPVSAPAQPPHVHTNAFGPRQSPAAQSEPSVEFRSGEVAVLQTNDLVANLEPGSHPLSALAQAGPTSAASRQPMGNMSTRPMPAGLRPPLPAIRPAPGRRPSSDTSELEELSQSDEDASVAVELTLRLARRYEQRTEDRPRAVTAYRRVLELDARNADALAGLVHLLDAQELWTEATDAIEQFLDAVAMEGGDPEIEAKWLREISHIYRDKLGDLAQADSALEQAAAITGQPLPRKSIATIQREASVQHPSAEAPAVRIDGAPASSLVSPSDLSALRAAFDSHTAAGRTDAAFCTAQVLRAALGSHAPREVTSLCDRYAEQLPLRPQAHIEDDDFFNDLLQDPEAARVGKLLAPLSEALARLLARKPSDLGLQESERLDPSSSPGALLRLAMPVYRTLHLSASTLGAAATPQLYWRPAHPRVLEIQRCVPPALLAAEALAALHPCAQSFLTGYCTLFYRPELVVLASAESSQWVHAAVQATLIAGGAEITSSDTARSLAAALKPALNREPAVARAARDAVKAATAHGTEFDVDRYIHAAERAALRAGLLLASDLAAALDALWKGHGSHAARDDIAQVRDLVQFATSEPYLRLRQRVGVGV